MNVNRFEHDPAAEDTLGGRISLGREAAGLTIAQAARRLGVLTESWKVWECDRGVPRVNRLTMMAGLLGVSPSWLLAGVGAGPVMRSDKDTVELLRVFRQTSGEVAALTRRMESIEASLLRQDLAP